AMEETGEPGYWAYAESLIGDVAGEANDATEWCDLPPTWFKELKGGSIVSQRSIAGARRPQ
ncbi:hypothetical protein, partial [Raoultella ornithinolytica]